MDARQQFLVEVLGPEGAAALQKAVDRYPDLTAVLIPRAILGWLKGEAKLHDDWDSGIPGCPDTSVSLVKSATGWSGHIKSRTTDYRFADETVFHAAGAIAIAMGLTIEPMDIKPLSLERLGKSIDLLAKAQVLKRNRKPPFKKVEPRGQVAGPQAPAAPQAAGAGGTVQKPPAIKGVPKAKKPALSIMKSESQRPCGTCGRPQFKGFEFQGCGCFAGLAKSVKVRPVGDVLKIEFGDGWTNDAIITWAEMFR